MLYMLLLKHLLPEIRVQHLLHQPQTAFQLPELPVRKCSFFPGLPIHLLLPP